MGVSAVKGSHRRTRTLGIAGRGLAVAGLAGGALMLVPHHAAAKVGAPCSATGYETTTSVKPSAAAQGQGGVVKTFNAADDTWTVDAGDYIGGSGTSTVPMKTADVDVTAFGFSITIVHATGDGGTGGSAGPYAISDWSKYVSRVDVSGGASGDNGSCSGSFTLVVNGKSAATTLVGGGGLVLGLLGLAGISVIAIRRI